MSVGFLTYQQSVFKRCHNDKHLSAFYPQISTKWRQKLPGIDKEQNYVTVTHGRPHIGANGVSSQLTPLEKWMKN